MWISLFSTLFLALAGGWGVYSFNKYVELHDLELLVTKRFSGQNFDYLMPILIFITEGGLFLRWHQNLPQMVIFEIGGLLLWQIFFFDLHYHLILSNLTYIGIVLALLGDVLWLHEDLVNVLTGPVAGLVLFGTVALYSTLRQGGQGFGWGDVNLAFFIGCLLGYANGVYYALDGYLLGILMGGIFGIGFLIWKKGGMGEFLPYGPFLAAGCLVVMFLK